MRPMKKKTVRLNSFQALQLMLGVKAPSNICPSVFSAPFCSFCTIKLFLKRNG